MLDFGIYVGLTRLTGFWRGHYVLAACVSFACAVLSSYLVNTYWTFRQQGTDLRRAAKFFAVATAGLGWNALIIWGAVRLGAYDLAAKVLATGAVLIWNFLLQKHWTFRPAAQPAEMV